MKSIGNWFRQVGSNLAAGMQRFMAGRYGNDQLNVVILVAGLALCIVGIFVTNTWASIILSLLAYGLLFWALFRCLSRNTYRRYRENRKLRMLFDRIRDRQHRYFDCPKCRQSVRVPRGKGKISITCPKCGEKFVRKT